MPCASMIFTAACATLWWREEIQLEALAQHGLVDLADAALPGRAGIRHDDVDAAERARRPASKAARTEAASVTSQCTAAQCRRSRRPSACAARDVDIEQRDLGAGLREGARGGRADGAAGAGDDGDLAGERLALPPRRAWPVRATSIRSRTCRLRAIDCEAADRLGVGDALDRGFGEVGGDAWRPWRWRRGRTGRGPAPARRAAAGSSIARAAGARVVAREIGLVVGDELLRRRPAPPA